jgi:hypothetical protein
MSVEDHADTLGRPSSRADIALIGSLVALCLVAAAPAARAAAHPNLTGMWILAEGEYNGTGAQTRHDALPLTPLGQRNQAEQIKTVETEGQVLSDAAKKCLPVGMPDLMGNEFALEVLDTGDRVTILSEDSTLPRNIYLDEAAHPKKLEPTWNGHSIGHWDGEALVVDTVGMNDRTRPVSFSGGVHSSTTHLVERIHMSADGKTLIDDMTFDDPRYLTASYTKRHLYSRLPKGSELWEYVCEVAAPGWSERYAGDPDAHLPAGQ